MKYKDTQIKNKLHPNNLWF